jgi:hypothetical protein
LKQFLYGLVTGILLAMVGTGILFLIFANIDLSCRDCQGAAGILLMFFFGAVAVLFVIGFLIGFFYKRKKDKGKIVEATSQNL